MKKELDYSALRYVIYCRRSSEDASDKQVQSIETQLRELEELRIRDNLNVVATFTESQSAHTPGREEFAKVVKILESGKANALLVVRSNRIARNPIDAGQIIYLMDRKKLLYIKTSSGTSYKGTPSDKTMLQVELAFNKKDSDDKSEMVKEGFRTKYLKGTPGGVAPFGFRNTPQLDRGARHWVLDEERYSQVKEMFRLFLTGTYSGNKMAEYCRDVLKMTTPQRKIYGGKLVEESYVNTMLKNPIYAGFFFSDGVRYELDRKLPRAITEEEHCRIIQMLGNKHQAKFQKHESVFAGFLKGENNAFMRLDPKFQLICDCKHKFAYRSKSSCPKCGKKICQMQNPKYLHFMYYYNGVIRHQTGKYKAVEEKEVLKKTNEEIIEPLSLCPELADWVKKHIHEVQDREINNGLNLNEGRAKLLESIDTEKANLRSQHRRGIITDEEYKKDLADLENKVPKEVSFDIDWKDKLGSIVDMGTECLKVFESSDVKAQKEILFKSQSNLIWNEEKLYIIRPKWLDTYVNGIKRYKSEIGTIEPKLIENKPNQNKDFLGHGVEKNELDQNLLHILDDVRTLYLEEERARLEQIKKEKYRTKAPLHYI